MNIATGRNLSRQSNALIVTSGPRFIFFRGAGFSFPSQTSSSGPFPPASSPCSRSVPLFFLGPGESFLLPSPSPCWVDWGLDQFKTIWLIKRPLEDFQRPNICKQIAGPPRGRTENLLIKSQACFVVRRKFQWFIVSHSRLIGKFVTSPRKQIGYKLGTSGHWRWPQKPEPALLFTAGRRLDGLLSPVVIEPSTPNHVVY